MKLCRILHSSLEGSRYALVDAGRVWPLEEGEQFGVTGLPRKGPSWSVEEVKLLAPVQPSKDRLRRKKLPGPRR